MTMVPVEEIVTPWELATNGVRGSTSCKVFMLGVGAPGGGVSEPCPNAMLPKQTTAIIRVIFFIFLLLFQIKEKGIYSPLSVS
jgi:hypothetical protein